MIIEIDGVGRVEVDDAFADMTTSAQNDFVQSIISQAGSGAASSEELESKPAADKQRLRSIGQGVSMGFGDEIEAAVRNPLSAIGGTLGLSEGSDYQERLEDIRGKLEAYREENPLEAMGYEIGGSILPALGAGLLTAGAGSAAVGGSTAARLAATAGKAIPNVMKSTTAARAATTGAASGAVSGFGASEGGFSERAKGAALGGTIGGTLGAAAPIAVQQAGRLGRNVMDAVGIGGQDRASTFAERKVLEAMERDKLTPEEAMAKLDEARDLGVDDITPADLGEGLRGAAWRAQATPNPTRQEVLDQFSERRVGQAEQISEQASEISGVQGSTGINYLDELSEKVQAQAEPAYRAAYKIDLDTAPFQDMAKSKVIQDAYNKAIEIADIDPDKSISGMPRDLGAFLNQVSSKSGGPAGISDTKIFMPTKVAHDIKKGLDSLIESETDTLTGKVTQRGRALTKLKKSWNAEIASQNEPYSAANKQFADSAKLRRAYDDGFDFNKTPEKLLVKKVGNMTASEKEALRVGLISQVQELASKTGDASDFVTTIFGSPRRRAALRMAFDTPDQFDRFERMMKIQGDKSRTQRKVFGGSETAERLIQSDDSAIDPTSIFSVGARLAAQDYRGAATTAGSRIASRLQGFNEKSSAELSQMLFGADAETQREIMKQLVKRRNADTAAGRRPVNRPESYSSMIGTTGGLLSGRSE